ncbi:hypothetical protein ABK040_011944 [Willaertia magna]
MEHLKILFTRDIFFSLIEYLELKDIKNLLLVCKEWSCFLIDEKATFVFKKLILNYLNNEYNFYHRILKNKSTHFYPRSICKEISVIVKSRIMALDKIKNEMNFYFVKDYLFNYWMKKFGILFSVLKDHDEFQNCKGFSLKLLGLSLTYHNLDHSIFAGGYYKMYELDVLVDKFCNLLKNCKEFKLLVENSKLKNNIFEMICGRIKDFREQEEKIVNYFNGVSQKFTFQLNDPKIFISLLKKEIFTCSEMILIIKHFGSFLFNNESKFCFMLKNTLLLKSQVNEDEIEILKSGLAVYLIKEYSKPLNDPNLILFYDKGLEIDRDVLLKYIDYCLKSDRNLMKQLLEHCKSVNDECFKQRKEELLRFFKDYCRLE